jgi:phosphodiesterase/alkaline phosphatase D-like protein
LNADTTYYCPVKKGRDENGYGEEINVTTASIPPIEPLVISTLSVSGIKKKSACLNSSLTSLGTAKSVKLSFQWGTDSGKYTNETPIKIMTSDGKFYYNLTGILAGKTYYYHVKAAGEEMTYGSEISFTTTGAKTKSITLKWNPVKWATKYLLQVNTSPQFDGEFLYNANIGKRTRQTVKGLTAGKKYYWRAKANNNRNLDVWFPVRSFTK